jgi:ankyrin repeat protein
MKKIYISLTFTITFFSIPAIKAMEKIEEEEPYQLSEQEKKLESYRNPNLTCPYCPSDGPPKLGVPLVEQTMQSDTLREITPEARNNMLQISVKTHDSKSSYWHERYHRALLIKYNAVLTEEMETFLLQNAVEHEDYMLVQFFLQHGINANKTPLSLLTKSKALTSLLVVYGANIHAKNKDGMSAFHLAASFSQTKVDLIIYCITQGMDINSVKKYNDSALHYVAKNIRYTEIENYNTIQKADFILHAGISLNIKNKSQQTAEDCLNTLLEKIDEEKLHNSLETEAYDIKKSAIKQILDLIGNERRERIVLFQPWKIFFIGWCRDNNAVHFLLPVELMCTIYELFKTSLLRNRINNWISKNNLN